MLARQLHARVLTARAVDVATRLHLAAAAGKAMRAVANLRPSNFGDNSFIWLACRCTHVCCRQHLLFFTTNVFRGGALLRNSRAGHVLPPAACDILLQCSQQQQHQQHQLHEFSSKIVVIITGTSSLHGGNTALFPLLSLLSSSSSLPISGLQELASNPEFVFLPHFAT